MGLPRGYLPYNLGFVIRHLCPEPTNCVTVHGSRLRIVHRTPVGGQLPGITTRVRIITMHVGAENLAWSALPVLFPVQVGERVQALLDEVRLDGRTSVRLPSTGAHAEHGIVEKLFHARPYRSE